MKNFAKILLPILAINLCVLSGCKKDENKNRVFLSFGDVHATGYKTVTVDEINSLVTREESFLLTVSSDSCYCWQKFEPKLINYASETKTLCYQIMFSDFRKLSIENRFGLEKAADGDTTFAIFNKGKLEKYINTTSNHDIMYSDEKFKQYMSENVVLPKAYFITAEDAKNIKNSGENAVIYYERSGCSDCNFANPTILDSYIKNHKDMKKIFVVDMQELYELDRAQYTSFKDEMGLSEVNNPIYGWGSGSVPYFSYIKNKEFASGAVIYNDIVSKVNEKYIVTNSYYTTERVTNLEYTNIVLQGQEIPANEMENGFWSKEKANKYYKDILESFLNTYLPQTTFTF